MAQRKPARRQAPAKTSRKAATAKAAHAAASRAKVAAFRKRMRAKGYRLVQMWIPDTRTPEFAAEARRQSERANNSPLAHEDQAWVDGMTRGTLA